MPTETYRLLLRNGQSLHLQDAVPDGDQVTFIASAPLVVPDDAWLQRSDGEMIEIRIVGVAGETEAGWRHVARLASEEGASKRSSEGRSWHTLWNRRR